MLFGGHLERKSLNIYQGEKYYILSRSKDKGKVTLCLIYYAPRLEDV
jgi:hypothetical protein